VTGKVQRKRLSASSSGSSEASPAAGWHAELLQLWKKFLKSENVSIDDDFFEKGGDSLLAMDLHMEVERLTGQELPESILLEASTVRQLAKRLSRTAGRPPRPVQAVSAGGRSPLMFFHDGGRAECGSLIGNLERGLGPEQPILAIACGGVDGKTAPRSIEGIDRRHIDRRDGGRPTIGDPGGPTRGPYRLAIPTRRWLPWRQRDCWWPPGTRSKWSRWSTRRASPRVDRSARLLISCRALAHAASAGRRCDGEACPGPLAVPLLVFRPHTRRELGGERAMSS
jgi:acyl carrier protein